jgi:GNAT superfamily N-acetyltransferase
MVPGWVHHKLPPNFCVTEFSELDGPERALMLPAVQSLEKKTFPAKEAQAITSDTISKANCIIAATPSTVLLGYAISVRWQHLLPHKICISKSYRRQGIGKWLLHKVANYARSSHCRAMDLWVDEGRHAARSLYLTTGFVEQQQVEDCFCRGDMASK